MAGILLRSNKGSALRAFCLPSSLLLASLVPIRTQLSSSVESRVPRRVGSILLNIRATQTLLISLLRKEAVLHPKTFKQSHR